MFIKALQNTQKIRELDSMPTQRTNHEKALPGSSDGRKEKFSRTCDKINNKNSFDKVQTQYCRYIKITKENHSVMGTETELQNQEIFTGRHKHVTHPISGVLRFRNPLSFRLMLLGCAPACCCCCCCFCCSKSNCSCC